MVNDSGPSTKSIEERFTIALNELIGMCAEAGMHLGNMIEPLKRKLAEIRQEAMPSRKDEARDAAQGLPPATEETIRKNLYLEPFEPLPAYRE